MGIKMRVTQLLVVVSLVSICSSSTPSPAKMRRFYLEVTSEVYEKLFLPLLPRTLKKKIGRVLPSMLQEMGGAVFDQLGSEAIMKVPFDPMGIGKLFEVVLLQMQDPKWEKMIASLKLTTDDWEKLQTMTMTMLEIYDKLLIGAFRIGLELGLRESNQI